MKKKLIVGLIISAIFLVGAWVNGLMIAFEYREVLAYVAFSCLMGALLTLPLISFFTDDNTN